MSNQKIKRIKPLAELRASDVPRGVDVYDLATDHAPSPSGPGDPVDGAGLGPRAHAEALAKQLELTPRQVEILAGEIRNALLPSYEFVNRQLLGAPLLSDDPEAVPAQRGIERALALIDALCRRELDLAVG